MPTVVRAAVRGLIVGVCAIGGAILAFAAALYGPVELATRVEGGLNSAVSGELVDQSGDVGFVLFPLVLGALGAVVARMLRLPAWVPAVPALAALVVAGALVLPNPPARWLDSVPATVLILVALLVSYPLIAMVPGRRRRA